MSSFHLPPLSYGPSASGGPMPNPSTLGSKQQDLQAVKQSVTAGPMSSKAKALKKESKASALPVEQSLASRRAKAVYTAMERLLEETVTDPQCLQSLVCPLSGEEYLQVAEERHLAGMCGSAACPNERLLMTGKHKLQGDTETGFCSSACELAARRLASRLGTSEAAMDRFCAASEKPMTPKKQNKTTSTYAAGEADNPIMLAQVKEKDPVMLQAEAQRQAALAKDTSAALAAGSEPNAVEGYVPRNSPVTAPAAAPKVRSTSNTATPDAATSTSSPDKEESLTSGQKSMTAGPAGHHNVLAVALPQAAQGTIEPSISGPGTSATKASPSEVHTDGSQNAGKGPQQPADGMQSSALASSSAQDGGEAECVASEGGASASADPAQQPVLVFEVEDPEGPLDTPSEDIGQHFGRLHLRTAAELGLPAQQLSQLAAAQCDTPQPTLEEDLELWKRHVGIQQGSGHEEADCVPAVAPHVRERVMPELPGEDAASEADLQSDEESALQWLSEPPPDFGRHLSGFGQVFTLLEGLVTERSAKLIRGSNHTVDTGLAMRSSLQGQAVLEGAVERVLGDVLKAMRVPALRSAVEQHLHRLAGAFNYAGPIPNLQGADWQMLTVVMLKALSLERLPALQEMFDSRAGAKSLGAYVSSIGYSPEELWSLLDLLVE